uniref:Uncharacterized protein n=1 Tax=Leersia perrieri TaxID=77586 RepID=A0A0D9X5Q2_9ORYZ
MEGWRKKVALRARRAWNSLVSGRLRSPKQLGSGGLLKLHEDVQTCDYKDVQVMFEMLTSELEASQLKQQQLMPPSPRKPPATAWLCASPSAIPADE